MHKIHFKNMKKILIIAVFAVLACWYAIEKGVSIPGFSFWPQSADSTLQNAYNSKQSDLPVQGKGIVAKVLPDDLKGSRHQRFILRLDTGQALLIAHNIDLAPKIKGLRPGDTIEFYGEYKWNEKGGVIHWTHHDPGSRHIGGWLKHDGKTYQ